MTRPGAPSPAPDDSAAAGSGELQRFRAELRDWLAKNLPPKPDFMLPQSFLEVETREQFDYLRAWQRTLYDAGYLGFDVPREYGGQGVDPARAGIVSQELGRAGAPFLVNRIALQWVAPTLLVYGTEAQKKRLIQPLLSAEEIWCQGFSEPGAGSDLASLETRAVKVDGGYRVTGHKVWTTLAHFARWMILLARTAPAGADSSGGGKYATLSYFLFPMPLPDAEGEAEAEREDDDGSVTIQPLVKMTREGGFNQVLFDGAFMPDDALLGREGQGWKIAMTTLTFERGADQSSNRERANHDAKALARVVELIRSTMRDGRPAAEDGVLRDRLAQLWIEVEAMRLGARRAAISGLCDDFPHALAMMHKLEFTEFAQRLHALACDVLGPEAMLWLGDPEAPDGAEWPRGLMNSYGFTIGGGTSEIQRNILGERVLGLPKSK